MIQSFDEQRKVDAIGATQHLQINNGGQDRFESWSRSICAQYYNDEWPVVA